MSISSIGRPSALVRAAQAFLDADDALNAGSNHPGESPLVRRRHLERVRTKAIHRLSKQVARIETKTA